MEVTCEFHLCGRARRRTREGRPHLPEPYSRHHPKSLCAAQFATCNTDPRVRLVARSVVATLKRPRNDANPPSEGRNGPRQGRINAKSRLPTLQWGDWQQALWGGLQVRDGRGDTRRRSRQALRTGRTLARCGSVADSYHRCVTALGGPYTTGSQWYERAAPVHRTRIPRMLGRKRSQAGLVGAAPDRLEPSPAGFWSILVPRSASSRCS